MNIPSLQIGVEAIKDEQYFKKTLEKIIRTREQTKDRLQKLGFVVLDSQANFLFVTHDAHSAHEIFEFLKEKRIFVLHFNLPRIDNNLRISIGTDEDMDKL
jgi:histidinol-phosphate aminotransferase